MFGPFWSLVSMALLWAGGFPTPILSEVEKE